MSWYPMYTRLGGPHGRYGRVPTISPQSEFDSRTVQPAAICYTNYAVPAHIVVTAQYKFLTDKINLSFENMLKNDLKNKGN